MLMKKVIDIEYYPSKANTWGWLSGEAHFHCVILKREKLNKGNYTIIFISFMMFRIYGFMDGRKVDNSAVFW